MSCGGTELPAEEAAAIVREIAGDDLPRWWPAGARITRLAGRGGETLLVATDAPILVPVVAPAPLTVSLALDAGGCLGVTRAAGNVSTRVDHATVEVRVDDHVAATWRLSSTEVELLRHRVVLHVPGGIVALDTAGAGAETLRTLVEVPSLHAWSVEAPAIVRWLGPAAPGVGLAALRAADGATGDPGQAGARISAGPGVAGARVWLDGEDLGILGDAPIVAPVGGLVTLRWEASNGVVGGVEAVMGPGVDMELRADGSARVTDRPKGPVCALRGPGENPYLRALARGDGASYRDFSTGDRRRGRTGDTRGKRETTVPPPLAQT